MKMIRCPHCQSVCPIGSGYYHDEKLNILCKLCHQIMLATNEDDERELQKLFTRPVKEQHDHHTSHSSHTMHNHVHGGYSPSHSFHTPGHANRLHHANCMGDENDGYD